MKQVDNPETYAAFAEAVGVNPSVTSTIAFNVGNKSYADALVWSTPTRSLIRSLRTAARPRWSLPRRLHRTVCASETCTQCNVCVCASERCVLWVRTLSSSVPWCSRALVGNRTRLNARGCSALVVVVWMDSTCLHGLPDNPIVLYTSVTPYD